MKNYLLVLVVLLTFSYSSYSQNSDGIKLSDANKELLEELRVQEQERLSRVQNFLNQNPNFKATIKEGASITHIYDIFDGKPVYKSTDNRLAAQATKTAELWTGGSLGLDLDGAGMTIGVWDGGPAFSSHVEFENAAGTESRVQIIDNTVVDGDVGFSSHGTHVTGTISARGANSSARGMAINVNVKSYNWSNDEAEIVSAINAVTNPIIVSNHSYGIPINQNGGTQLDAAFIGTYTQDARDVDNIARNNPKYLLVASAGNSGITSYPGGKYPGFDKLTTDKNAKNSLVIANANPTVAEQPIFSGNFELTNLVINQGSSQGPTDDLRIKPDIAADGTNLFSPTPNGTYSTFSGTSMSSPNTAGTLVLLQQYYNQLNGDFMNSSTLKGLVCHTAIDDNNAGPDPVFGWGFLNARASVQTIAGALSGDALVDELTLDNNGTYTFTFTAQAGEKLSATLCWTDMPGSVSSTTNDPTPKLVNDLDLRISDGTTTYLPWKLDFSGASGFSNSKGDNSVDNVERIDIEVPTSGMYTLTVTHKGTLQGNVGGPFDPQSQDFSLIVTGNNLVLSVDENDLARNLSVYPNPSNGEFTISFQSNLNSNNNNVKVDVYDVQGRLVYDNTFTNSSSVFKETIALNNAKPGIYMVNISEGNRTTTHKLIIK
ncbi:S8 family serine peptidase [uncultured Winogradskyella sp.]|uniref:S8 family serine peptidase n=1 Tax=uncultured Winogradskyella sp. TaxID=395353 RepID=UPI00262D4CA6|nr:S8 family serine peptidase [uncultured Winogradskyella sp.]